MGIKFIIIFCVFGLTMQHGTDGAANKTNPDLTRISWAHAVNSLSALHKALNDKSIDMIEADVILGRYKYGPNNIIPIMGHPPANTSDLSLEDFLTNVTVSRKKGVKLDFKSIDVFIASNSTMQRVFNKKNFPFWLNADILKGPTTTGRTVLPVDPDRFLSGAQNYSQAVLSLGWTTIVDSATKKINYTDVQIDDMLSLLRRHNIKQNVTFAVRAGVAAESIPQMKRLVTWPNSTLTIWLSNSSDPVNVYKLKRLINEIGRNRTYLDVPESLKKKLGSSGSMLKYSAYVLLLAFLVFLFNSNMKL